MMHYNKHVLQRTQNTTKYLPMLCPILSVYAFMHRVEPLHNSLINTHYVNKHNQTILTNTVSILSGQTVPVELVSNSLHTL